MDFQHGHRQQQQQMNNVGLTRYRSAPSSYFTSFLDTVDNITGSSSGQGMDDLDHFLNRFMPNNSVQGQESINPINTFTNTSMNLQSQTQFVVGTMKQEPPEIMQQEQQPLGGLDYSQMMFQSQDSAEVEVQRNQNIEASNKLLSSENSNRLAPMKMSTGSGGGANSNLIRYNSSPAGFFDNLNLDNEYGAMRGAGSFGAGNNANAEASFSSASRFKGFSSGQSSSGLMPSISEIGTKGTGESSSSHRNDDGYITGFPVNSWDDSSMLSENLLKGLGTDNKAFSNVAASGNQFVNQGNEGQNDPPATMLSRHMSLPSTSVEFSAMETLMQDSVLCKMRAKRGCATHPRSIAERVRRTRISERMRRLQEAVPNMDKQTNTSDMLDLAVDYIKDLQQQVEILLDNRAKCTCPNE